MNIINENSSSNDKILKKNLYPNKSLEIERKCHEKVNTYIPKHNDYDIFLKKKIKGL